MQLLIDTHAFMRRLADNLLLLATLCGTLMPAIASGQIVGDRVRVTAGPDRIVGVVARVGEGQLELVFSDGGSQVVSVEEVTRLERSVVRLRWELGFLIGAGVGAVGGVTSERGNVLLSAGGFASVGTVVGAQRSGVRWERFAHPTGHQRLRVIVGRDEVVGEVVRMSADALELALPNGSTRVVRSEEVSRVDRAFTRRLWLDGYAVGALAGICVLTSYALDRSRGEPGTGAWIGAPISGAVFGGLLGLGVGGLIKAEDWESVLRWGHGRTLPRRGMSAGPLLGLQPGQSGSTSLILGMRIRF